MRHRMRHAALLALLLLLSLPWPAFAFVPRGGENVGFSEMIHDDLYIAGGTVTVTGIVDGDVTAAGGTVTLTGRTSGALLAAGGTVDIGGSVGRSIRAAGGTVRLDAATGTDAVLAGGNITVAETGRVGRDLVVGGGTVRIAGAVGRNVFVGGGNVVIAGSVQGNVDVQVDRLLVLPTARIAGRLRYAAGRSAEIQPGAEVSGGVERVAAVRPGMPLIPARRSPFRWFWRVGEWLWLLALGLVAFALLPRLPGSVVSEIRARFGASLLAGVLVLVAAPVAVMALLISVIGIPLAVAVILLWFLTLYPSQLFAATWLGERVVSAVRKGSTPSVSWALVVGVTILVILYAVPFVGWVFRLLAVLAGLGSIWLAVWRSTRMRAPSVPASPAATA